MSNATILGYRVLVDPDADGSFVVRVPVFPGCEARGKTLVQARERAHQLIGLHIEMLLVHEQPVPARDVPLTPRCSVCGTTDGEILEFGRPETADECDFECRACWGPDEQPDADERPDARLIDLERRIEALEAKVLLAKAAP